MAKKKTKTVSKIKLTMSDGTTVKVKPLALYGCLALHNDGDRTVVTHMPTGASVMSISQHVPHEVIAPFLLKLSEALADVKERLSLTSEAGRRALPWLDLLKQISRVYEAQASRRDYVPIAFNRAKAQPVRRTFLVPANYAPSPNVIDATAVRVA